ncbi:hypothetical protein HPB51_014822 [Rhipicephalus microplus]|uniref:ADAM10 endopeptidase n=1 Tax=Rhipicephalus microplus TaxID=6941 RepID=A0A9J6DMV0_RHIMP|nr:hypothetical protein HPB51_014822 [Rhipicephalus microplus]
MAGLHLVHDHVDKADRKSLFHGKGGTVNALTVPPLRRNAGSSKVSVRADKLGGACEKFRSVNTREGIRRMALNTGVITLYLHGGPVALAVSEVTVAHEIGHSFGALHDETPECAPGGANGNYIMFARATTGRQPFNRKFSPCSIRGISAVLSAILNGLYDKENCFLSHQESFCGNNVREENEDCDCGYNEKDCHDLCCYARKNSQHVPGCTLRPNAQCSPSAGSCCSTDCHFVSANQQCSAENECNYASFCRYPSLNEFSFPGHICSQQVLSRRSVSLDGSASNETLTAVNIRNDAVRAVYGQVITGVAALCPEPRHKANLSECNRGTQVCLSGRCEGSICQKYGYDDCQRSSSAGSSLSPADMCLVDCMRAGTDGHCVGTCNEPTLSSLCGRKRERGAACNQNRGYCDVFHRCRTVDEDGPLARLEQLLVPNRLREWFKVSLARTQGGLCIDVIRADAISIYTSKISTNTNGLMYQSRRHKLHPGIPSLRALCPWLFLTPLKPRQMERERRTRKATAPSDKGPYLSRHKDRQISGPSSTRLPSPLPLKPMTAKDSKSAATAAKEVERENVVTPKEANTRIADGTAASKDGIAKRIIVANKPAAKTAYKTGEDGVKTLEEAASSKPQIASGATAIKEGIASPKTFVATPAALTVNAGERPLTTRANAAANRLGAVLENQRKPSVLPKPNVKSPTSAPKEPHASPAGAKATATADIPTRVGHLINNLLQRAVGKWEIPERLPEKLSGLPTILEAQRSPLRQEARGAQLAPLVVKADDTSQKNSGLSRQVPVSEKAAGTAKPSNTFQEVALPTFAKNGPQNNEVSPRPVEHKEAEAELFKKGLRDKPSITDNQDVVDEKLLQPVFIKPVKTAHEGNIRKPDKKSSPSDKQMIILKELKVQEPTETKTARKSTVARGVNKKKKERKGLMHSEKETDSSEQTEVLEEDVHKAEKVSSKKALPQVEQVLPYLKQPTSKKAAYAAVNLVEATQAVGETKFAPEKSQKPTHHH